jgi:hypothetical protein
MLCTNINTVYYVLCILYTMYCVYYTRSGGGTHTQGEAKSDAGDECVDWESNPLGRDTDISSVYSGTCVLI